MGLTSDSTGFNASSEGLKSCFPEGSTVIALAGNPNVGKSTVFNELTGLHQHTGNWTGKTVANACGEFKYHNRRYILVDIPGTYSLSAHSAEEEVARNFICFGNADAVAIVCDATNLERNMNLVLQTIEACKNTIVCVNLIDEAQKRNISININKLEKILGVPVTETAARSKKGIITIPKKAEDLKTGKFKPSPYRIEYPKEIENAVSVLIPPIERLLNGRLNSRFTALKILENDELFIDTLEEQFGLSLFADEEYRLALAEALKIIDASGLDCERIKDRIVSRTYIAAEKICSETVTHGNDKKSVRQLKADRLLTGRLTGIPVMLLLLAVVFWLTIEGANYPSKLLSDLLFGIGDFLRKLFSYIGIPEIIISAAIDGIWRVLAWVVAVMLPPMAIFFPLFTLLEDSGYLPRIAFNLDHVFQKCKACGKQALTMWIRRGIFEIRFIETIFKE